MEYTSTGRGVPAPLTLAACHPGWDDYLDLGETVTEMAHRLMEEEGRQVQMPSTAGATPKPKDVAQVTPLPPDDDTTLVSALEFPGGQLAGSSRDNPVHLSDATNASASGSCPMKDAEPDNDAAVLGHYSDALQEMAASIIGLEDGYFQALREVIIETEKALCDVSHIDVHYVSRMVTVMTTWQEAVQAAASHMEVIDTTTYLAHREDARRATHKYVKEVMKAREERDATHAEEQKKAIKEDDFKDPIVRLLDITCKAAHAQAEKAVEAFLASIKATLHKHIPAYMQEPLIANALSTAFQFQMSVWRMIGKECVRPIQLKHSDWCGLAGIVQAIVEMFPKNCALMFPPAPAPAPPTSFSSTFKPASSDENDDDDDDTLGTGGGFRRFESSTPTPFDSGRRSAGGFSRTPSFTSTPLPHGGAFVLATDQKEMPSGASRIHPGDQEHQDQGPFDEDLDLGIEADDKADGDKEAAEDDGDEPTVNPEEVKMLKGIIKKVPTGDQPPTAPKSGDKRGSTHLDGGSGSSDSSAEDLDTSRSTRSKKKGGTPTKASHPNQWSDGDINIMRQIRYKTDLKRFQTYHTNKIAPADTASINTRDHSAYLDVARADPSSVIRKSVFSVVAYCATLEQQGGDVFKFDKEVGPNFKKGAKGSRALDSEKVPINWVMLVCQWESRVDVVYSNPDGFGRPGTMGLWDLHSTEALSWAKMQLASGLVDANFCPLCAFWSTNNETLNNHICKHYRMGLTCRANGFTTASVAAMKAHMEMEHGYKGKRSGQAKKSKGKG